MLGAAAPVPFDPAVLRRARDLRAVGVEPSDGGWHQVRHGVWTPVATWARCTPEHRHAALVHATAMVLGRDEPVFALTSAAAVWGLPRVEEWPASVRVLVPEHARGRSTALVRPHVGRDDEPVEREGIRVTSVARTVVDTARTSSLLTAFAAADHALRHGLCRREDLVREADAVPRRVRGRPAAKVVAELADGRSMSPGESLSRAQMFLLNVRRPRLQEEVHDEAGLIGVADFGWDGVVGEFDGRVKYRLPESATPEEVAEVVWAEKLREDRLRRRRRVARWTWSVAVDQLRLAGRLAEVGIRPLPTRTWIDLGRPV